MYAVYMTGALPFELHPLHIRKTHNIESVIDFLWDIFMCTTLIDKDLTL